MSRFKAGPRFGVKPAAAGVRPAHVAKAESRRVAFLRRANDALAVLPGEGESAHCLMTGYYDLMHVVAELCRREGPVERLRLATLSYNARNLAEIESILNGGAARRVDLLASTFFRNHNRELFGRTRAALAGRGAVAAAPSHAKVALFSFAGGGVMVFEGSANLRTNRSREQLMMTRDRGVHDWHAAWIDEAIADYERNPEPEAAGDGPAD